MWCKRGDVQPATDGRYPGGRLGLMEERQGARAVARRARRRVMGNPRRACRVEDAHREALGMDEAGKKDEPVERWEKQAVQKGFKKCQPLGR